MSVLVDVVGSTLRVRLCGELDLACVELFDSLFDLETEGIDTVVLDLGALTFCDVGGANQLTGLCAFHRCQGRDVQVVDVLPQVQRLIAWTQHPAQQSSRRRARA
jgi:anti-anti-sigma factor